MREQGEEEEKDPRPEGQQEIIPGDDYEEASASTANYANYQPPRKKRSPVWRKLGYGLGVLILVAAIGGGTAYYLKNHKSAKKTTGSSQTSPANAASAASTIDATTKHYDSSNFYLGFDYPADWPVADNGGGFMSVTSPAMGLKSADGQSVTGRIVLSFRSKDQKLPEFDSGNAVAAIASVKIAYVKPTQNQRGSSYESFLRYAATANAAGLDGIYITGDSGYTLGQAIPKVDVQKVDPIISITFSKCQNAKCSGAGMPLSISAASWDDKTFSQPLENMLRSLSIN